MTNRTIDWQEVLVCPRCRGQLQEVDGGLLCGLDRRFFPIIDGVPHMTEECSRRWTSEDAGERK